MNTRNRVLRNLAKPAAVLLAAGITSCGGGGGTSQPPPPPEPTAIDLDVILNPEDVPGGSTETGSGMAAVSYHETDGEIEIAVTLTNVSADTVSLNTGYAGVDGELLFELGPGGSADDWQLAASPLTETDIANLENGALYLEVTTADHPSGALRGQILPSGIELERIALTPEQVTSGSSSGGSGTAWATVDSADALLTVHAVTTGLDDTDVAEIRQGKAGTDGAVLASLAQDAADASHWLLDTGDFTAEMQSAADAGELYLTFATPAAPDGAIRGQWIPDGLELIVTELTGDAVVMGKLTQAAKTSGAASLGRIMTTLEPDMFTSHVNLFSIADADAVELRQAPAGQNGPVVGAYQQDANEASRWSLEEVPINEALQANFDSQTLYVNVATLIEPNGIARGQLVSEVSMAPVDDSAFVVESIDPPNAAEVTSLPDNVVATLNRASLPASVGGQAVLIEASGLDGSFADGNEVIITPASVTADGNAITISLAGVQADDDVYRVSLFGGGDNGIVDLSGIPLDGDADGEPGGVFEAAFELATPEVSATFSEIQEQIFTPTCAVSGCHTGSNPPDGLNLSAGVAYSNIVNVASVQMPELFRIEPGDPDNSYLVRKVEGAGIVANRMPLGTDPLPQELIDLIRQWVIEGAEDN